MYTLCHLQTRCAPAPGQCSARRARAWYKVRQDFRFVPPAVGQRPTGVRRLPRVRRTQCAPGLGSFARGWRTPCLQVTQSIHIYRGGQSSCKLCQLRYYVFIEAASPVESSLDTPGTRESGLGGPGLQTPDSRVQSPGPIFRLRYRNRTSSGRIFRSSDLQVSLAI
jgi:hypothetical protein